MPSKWLDGSFSAKKSCSKTSQPLCLRAMAASGILVEILPGALNLSRLERLVAIDADNFFTPDALLRLAALLPPDESAAIAIARKLRLSTSQRDRLIDIAGAQEKIVSYLSIKEVRKLLYRLGPSCFRDRVFLRWAEDLKASNTMQWRALLALADSWQRPHFPLTGENVTSSDRHCSRSSLYIALPIAPTFDPRSTFSVLAWL